MALPTMPSGLVSREFLRIAGGYEAPSLGTSPIGGLDIDNAGNVATDGDVTIKGVISAGSTPQALTNAGGLIDGGKIQDGTVNTAELADDAVTPAKLADTGDFLVNSMTLGGNIALTGGGNIGTDTDTDLLGIADDALTVNGNLIVDTDTLFVNASANEVGVNTSNPRGPLHVVGSAGAPDGTPAAGIFKISDTEGLPDYVQIGFDATNSWGWIQAVTPGSGVRNMFINPSLNTIVNDLMLKGGGNIGTDTDTDLLGIADNALTVNGSLAATGTITAGSGATLLTNADGTLKGAAIEPVFAGTKLSIAAGVLNHDSGGGNEHLPTGGAVNQTLVYGGTSGTASWSNDLDLPGTLDVTGVATFDGAVKLGGASTDLVTVTGRLLLRSVTDAGPMTATAGTQREIVYNTSDSKFYGCTATGSPATWSALN